MNQNLARALKATTLEEDLQRHYSLTLGRDDSGCETRFHLYQALALTVRDQLVARGLPASLFAVMASAAQTP